MLVLETKGQQTDADKAKHKYAHEWVEAVTEHGGFGQWYFDISREPTDIVDILQKYGSKKNPRPRTTADQCTAS